MKKKIYFLSIFILFLINITGVNALSSTTSYGTSTSYSRYFGSSSAAGSLPYDSRLATFGGPIPGSTSTPLYFLSRLNFDANDEKGRYINSVIVYNFCTSLTTNQPMQFNVTGGSAWSVEFKRTGKGCSYSPWGGGVTYSLILKTNFDGDNNFYTTYTMTPQFNTAWWIGFIDYEIFTNAEYIEYQQNLEINTNLNDLNNKQEETNNKLDDLNDNLTDSDSSEASGEAGNFFSNFNTDTFGLTSVITAPLELIKSVTSKTCTPLQGTLPFVNTEVNFPCLSTIYESHFSTFLTIYRTITFGFVSYWVCIKIFNLVKDFKNPEHDEIEVLDL